MILHLPTTTGLYARKASEAGPVFTQRRAAEQDDHPAAAQGEHCKQGKKPASREPGPKSGGHWDRKPTQQGPGRMQGGQWNGQQPCKVRTCAMRAPKHAGSPADCHIQGD